MKKPESPEPTVASTSKASAPAESELKSLASSDAATMPEGLRTLKDQEIRDLFTSFRTESKRPLEQ